jgi:hypothetical protein
LRYRVHEVGPFEHDRLLTSDLRECRHCHDPRRDALGSFRRLGEGPQGSYTRRTHHREA